MENKYVIGLYCDKESVSGSIARVSDGQVMSSSNLEYGELTDEEAVLETAREALAKCPDEIRSNVIAVAIDNNSSVSFSEGKLADDFIKKLSLPANVKFVETPEGMHMDAIGVGIEPHSFVRSIRMSTFDLMVSGREEIGDNLAKGACGQLDASAIPDTIGFDGGKSMFGNIYAWLRRLLEYPLTNIVMESDLIPEEQRVEVVARASSMIIPMLAADAKLISPSDSGVLAIDWINGQQAMQSKGKAKGAITGLSLDTTAPMIFRALVEATAFGSKSIVDGFRRNGISIDKIVAVGGFAQHSPFVMQILSDVHKMPIMVSSATQTPSLGAAMYAAVAAGAYRDIEEAAKSMRGDFDVVYNPIEENVEIYSGLYKRYQKLGEFTESEFVD